MHYVEDGTFITKTFAYIGHQKESRIETPNTTWCQTVEEEIQQLYSTAVCWSAIEKARKDQLKWKSLVVALFASWRYGDKQVSEDP